MLSELQIASLDTYKSERNFPQPTTNHFPTKLKFDYIQINQPTRCINRLDLLLVV
jgi:hypothetical protein